MKFPGPREKDDNVFTRIGNYNCSEKAGTLESRATKRKEFPREKKTKTSYRPRIPRRNVSSTQHEHAVSYLIDNVSAHSFRSMEKSKRLDRSER